MAYKNSDDDLTEEWWDVLMISPDASVRDIHQAYERLRMSYLPMNRDRSIPISAEATEQLQKLDRAFRLGLDSKNPSATLGKTTSSKTSTKVASKTNAKASNKSSTQATPQPSTGGKDPFHSVVQDWTKASSQSSLPNTSGSTTNTQAGTWPHTTGDTQNTQPTKKKSAKGDAKASKKGGNGYLLLFIFIICGMIGYLFSSDSPPASSNASRTSTSAPAPRATPNNAPPQAPQQYNPSAPVADPLVVALQQELNRRGFNAGVVDGLIGPQTISAISAAQSSFNMYIDGKPSEALLRALRRN